MSLDCHRGLLILYVDKVIEGIRGAQVVTESPRVRVLLKLEEFTVEQTAA